MKIYAKQTPPEWQESPLFHDEWDENIFVFGNRRLSRHTTDFFDDLPYTLDNLADELNYFQSGKLEDKKYTWGKALKAFAPRENGQEYTRSDRLKWIEIIKRWEHTDEESEVFRDVLTLVKGEEYKLSTIRGCCQGGWNNVLYPVRYGREWFKAFEVEYFNLGTEWEVKEDDDDPGYIIYCTTDNPRKEIADMANTASENVILYEFDGWEHTPKYKEVQQ